MLLVLLDRPGSARAQDSMEVHSLPTEFRVTDTFIRLGVRYSLPSVASNARVNLRIRFKSRGATYVDTTLPLEGASNDVTVQGSVDLRLVEGNRFTLQVWITGPGQRTRWKDRLVEHRANRITVLPAAAVVATQRTTTRSATQRTTPTTQRAGNNNGNTGTGNTGNTGTGNTGGGCQTLT